MENLNRTYVPGYPSIDIQVVQTFDISVLPSFLRCACCFSNDLDNTWCKVNGSKRKGTFNPDKAKTCPKFCPRGESKEPFYFDAPVDYDALIQGKDYQIWVNPSVKDWFPSLCF